MKRLGRPLLALVAALLGLSSCATTLPATMSEDGTAIRYATYGDGDTALVFVHGWSCDQSYWREQIQPFQRDYAVVTLDLGGHGQSSSSRTDWSIGNFAEDVIAVAARLEGKPLVLVGHSMGGPVVVEAARRLGPRVMAVIGVDTLRTPTAEPTPQAAAMQIFNQSPDDFPSWTEAFVRQSFFTEQSPKALVEQIARDMAAADSAIANASGIGLITFDSAAALRGLGPTPLILINASYQPSDAAGLKSLHRNSRIVELNDTGHFPMLESPNRFNATLQSVLNEITSD